MTLSHHVPRKVCITEDERAKLMSLLLVPHQVMQVTFTRSEIWLENVPENAWVFPILAEWRGLNK